MKIQKCLFGWCRDCRQLKCIWRGFINWLSIFSVLALLVGCGYLPLRPGRSSFVAGATTGQLRQSQNPQSESKQVFIRTSEAGKTTETVETTIGAAQRDTAREMAAKLGSLRGVVWIGILVFLFGVASAFWLPLKAIVGSITTSAVIALSGLALLILPTLIVGNEILILCVALGAAGLYWFSHRHGSLRGAFESLKNGN